MGVFWAKALTTNPQTGQPMNVPPGAVESFVVNFPGNLQQFLAHCRQQGLGTRHVRYVVVEVPPDAPEYMVMAVQPFMGHGYSPQAQAPQVSAQHVNGGQPTGSPMGQAGQSRPGMQRDPSSGFQVLGDADLGTSGDAMYGSPEDGTSSDLIQGGWGSQEIPRQT